MRRGAWISTGLALSLVVAACSGDRDRASRTSFVESTLPAPVAAASGRGTLAIIDGSGNVATIEPDGSNKQIVAEQADGVAFRQPVWAPLGEGLAWSEASSDGFSLAIHDGADTVSIAMAAPPFYAMWSPDGSQIGVLHNAANGGPQLEFELVDVDAGTSDVAATGGPFYFTWSPGGEEILSHVGATTLSVHGAGEVEDIGDTDGDFQAPAWTDAGIYHVADGAVVLRDSPSAEPRRLGLVTGPATLVATPDGRRVAVQAFGPLGEGQFASYQSIPQIPLNTVVVLEAATGTVQVASGEPSFGFFWSPDGESLLMLVSSEREGELEWRVWREGETTASVSYVPDESVVRELLPFFDQYAQSWRPWAPDSSAFAFAGTVEATDGVWVQELDADAPRFVSEGSWVAWSAE